MRHRRAASIVIILPLLLAAAACTPSDAEDFGIDEDLLPVGPMGKDDGAGRAGPLVATNTSATQVWVAKNKWEDRDTAAARAAGLAWPANSGLSWDEKYSRWIDSLPVVDAAAGYKTISLTTPWGKTVTAPVLECAETAIVLRATFAAWYQLPFMMESRTASGARVYFGHFGIRTASGRYAGTPDFALKYKDYSTAADLAAHWPTDSALRQRAAAGGEDEQLIAGGGHFGAYLDEIHANKRAGHLIIYLVNYFGSANLVDAANTYNLVPEAIRPGDLLMHRWQRIGIGDTKIIKVVGQTAAGEKTARLMSGSMPRRQPKLYTEIASKGYFTEEDTGGPGTNSDGDKYFRLGGGAKRWRVTKNVGGYWTNTWMSGDEASWINDQDEARITARPARFDTLLNEVSPAEKKAGLLLQIDDSRAHLLQYPASCAARERRERAFAELYELAPRLGTTRAKLDAELRTRDDYVFAQLDYAHAKTCCWNSSTAGMADVILDYADQEQASMCVAPTVFRAENGGYQRWAAFAASTGRATTWKPWTEDETCAQRDTITDALTPAIATDYCALDDSTPSPSCTDTFEPNDARSAARALPTGTAQARICAGGDHDYYSVTGPGTVTLSFTHSSGDLDLELLDASGTRLAISESTGNTEQVTVPSGTSIIHVYGYDGAANTYTISR